MSSVGFVKSRNVCFHDVGMCTLVRMCVCVSGGVRHALVTFDTALPPCEKVCVYVHFFFFFYLHTTG